MEWFFYALTFVIAIGITSTAVYALYWASKNGQLRDFGKGATVIFDEEEPVGKPTDFFPQKRTKKEKKQK